MTIHTRQKNLTPQQWAFHGVTLGVVVDTNDPQQMGRARAVCRALGDDIEAKVTDVPWASYAAPFAGTTQVGSKGVGSPAAETTGPVAYGMWGIPKVGANVLIMCIDGDPQTRVWVGCLPVQHGTHTMPHGRYSYKDNDAFPDSTTKPVGPMTGYETEINPLSQNFKTAFGDPPEGDHNFEFASRAADFQVSGIKSLHVPFTGSSVSDDDDIDTGLGDSSLQTSRQGYQTNRQAPNQFVPERIAPRNLDNMVTSIVSPGFHAISMDDREENSRIRIRTVGGNQIIMDDTNERVYISTAKGENWIEIDERGNIDIYTSGKLSAHAKEDINFTTDSSFRVYAKKGIQMTSDLETRITSNNDISVKSNQGTFRAQSQRDVLIESTGQDVHLRAGANMFATTQDDLHIKSDNLFIESRSSSNIKSGQTLNIQAGSAMNLLGGSIIATGGPIHLNGPQASSAESAINADRADPNNDFTALFVNRVPDHEPWPRVDTKNDTTLDDLYEYTNTEIGRKRRITDITGRKFDIVDIPRNKNWRR